MLRPFGSRSTQLSGTREAVTEVRPQAGVVYANAYERKERLLDAALDDYCALRDAGQNVVISDFCRRYPSFQRSLRKLIDVHEALHDYDDAVDEPWPEPGDMVLGFRLLKELGAGAFARVFLASEPALGHRLVAVKITRYETGEAATLGRLIHRNIVPIHAVDHDPDSGTTAVCMPYLGPSTLADVLDFAFQDGRPPERAVAILQAAQPDSGDGRTVVPAADEAPDPYLQHVTYVDGILHLGVQIAEALKATHESGVTHRDLKPSNVLVTPAGRPMLLDFNLSCDLQRPLGRLGGTLPYMPPEQIKVVYLIAGAKHARHELAADPRSDIFALGVVLYEALSGRLPFGDPAGTSDPQSAGEHYLEAQHRPPVPLERLNRHVDTDVARLIDRCLALDASERPSDAATLVRELRSRQARPARLRRWLARQRWAVATVGGLLLLCASLFAWQLATRPPYGERIYRKALENIEAGEYDDALTMLATARREFPREPRIPFAEGLVRWEQEDYDMTTRSFEEALELTDERLVMECRAFSYYLRDLNAGAVTFYLQLIDKYPRHARSRVNLGCGWSYYDPEYAVREASVAIEIDREMRVAYELRALGQYLLAVKSRDQFNLDAEIINNDLQQALADAERAFALGADNSFLRYTTARILKMQAEMAPERKAELGPAIDKQLQAVSPPLGRRLFEGEFGFFVGEPWYEQRRASLPRKGGVILIPTYYLTLEPDKDEIWTYLRGFDATRAAAAASPS